MLSWQFNLGHCLTRIFLFEFIIFLFEAVISAIPRRTFLLLLFFFMRLIVRCYLNLVILYELLSLTGSKQTTSCITYRRVLFVFFFSAGISYSL
jgi:hypothetical protein